MLNRKPVALIRPGGAFVALAALSAALVSGHAAAQAFPTKPIRSISPYAPGGGNDIISRAIAPRLGAQLGQQVIVENKPGANTIIGTEILAKSPPDGYTIILLPSSLTINPHLYAKLPYDTLNDFTPISMVGMAPLMLAANASSPYKTLKDVIAAAKARPGELTYSTAGAGGSGHLAGGLLAVSTGIQLQHVPYKGSAPAATALLANEVALSFSPPANLLTMVRAGKLVAIGMSGERRSPVAPDVPTIAESGVPGYEASLWYGYLGPARLPRDVLQRLNAALVATIADKGLQEVLSKQGIDPFSSTPEQFARVVAEDVKKWGPVVKAAGIKAE